MKLFVATSLSLALAALTPVHAQTCTPSLVGLPTGPYERGTLDIQSWIGDMMPFDDGSGPALIVAGELFLPDIRDISPVGQSEIYSATQAARYQNGRWSPMPATNFGGDAFYLNQADFSSVGGADNSIYAMFHSTGDPVAYARRWTGSDWSPVGTPTTSGLSLLSHTDSQGPALLMGGANPQGVLAWRGSGAWTPYAPYTRSSGSITRLRLLDDGDGPALFAMGSMRDNSRNLRALMKLVNGEWTQYDLPAEALAANDVTDIAFFDDGTSTTGPELYVAWRTTAGSSLSRRRNGAWETLATAIPSANTLTGACLIVADVQGSRRLYHSGAMPLREWTAAGWSTPFTTRHLSSVAGGVINDVVNFDDGQGAQTYFGGQFTDVFEGTTPYPGNRAAPAYGLIRTSDQGLTSLAQGFGYASSASAPLLNYLSSIELPEGSRLIVGGPIERAGGQFARFAAMFDGAQWFNFNASTQPVMSELRSAATAVIEGQPRIVANRLGAFYSWDGALWQPLASQPSTGTLTKLFSFQGSLYAAGSSLQRFTGSSWELIASGPFTAVTIADLGNGPRALLAKSNSVHEFDGLNLAQVGPTTSGVAAVAVVNDAPGPRIYIHSSTLPNRIARLTNGTWEELPAGVHNTTSSTGFAIASFDDGDGPALYVAGHSSVPGTLGPIARWRNDAWDTPAPLTNTYLGMLHTPAMAVVGDRLYIAGTFSRINNVTADHLAWIQACPRTCVQDYNNDGDSGTDDDIEAFFACLAGNCCHLCTADFNNDGDTGTDADIESFFRVLAGGNC